MPELCFGHPFNSIYHDKIIYINANILFDCNLSLYTAYPFRLAELH